MGYFKSRVIIKIKFLKKHPGFDEIKEYKRKKYKLYFNSFFNRLSSGLTKTCFVYNINA